MARAKEVLAAGVVRDLLFRDIDAYEQHIYRLENRHERYQVIETMNREDGSVIARILSGYNNSPLIQLFDE